MGQAPSSQSDQGCEGIGVALVVWSDRDGWDGSTTRCRPSGATGATGSTRAAGAASGRRRFAATGTSLAGTSLGTPALAPGGQSG